MARTGIESGTTTPDPDRNAGFLHVSDPEAFARNMTRAVEEAQKAFAAWATPKEGAAPGEISPQAAEMIKTFTTVAEAWMTTPERVVKAQSELWRSYLDLWAYSMRRLLGEPADPVVAPQPKDRRFADPEWVENQFFDFIKQAYLLTAKWAETMVVDAEGLDDHTRHKAEFYLKQIINAVAPSNFLLTNPELLRETFSSNGENLVRGMQILAEDIRAGQGELKIRQTDTDSFAVGRNLALTPGKVVFRNELIELIQYTPATDAVFRRPLLFVPPWINKYYILDLTPEKSMVKWLVEQGHTVFMISWVNPDERLAKKTFADYIRQGVLEAVDVIRTTTDSDDVNVAGYCVGGTLLGVSLGYMAATRDERIASASFLATQVDFTHAGDLKVFVDQDQLAALERRMSERGYLEGGKMAAAFNMLRSNDLIWPYVINNYMKGKEPLPFDLLYWNSDSTRMPAANHVFYLRHCYLQNDLAEGRMTIGNVRIDLKRSRHPIYTLAAREDHIAPPRSVFLGAGLFGGEVRFVLAGSGHIAGVVNPPARGKYQYWTGGPPKDRFEAWTEQATEHPGSWWLDWAAWLEQRNGPDRVPARSPVDVGLGDAPGTYATVKD